MSSAAARSPDTRRAVRNSRSPWARASEAKLDSLYSPLVYLMKADERGRYGSLGVEGKRAFLRQFWKRRDPTPDTPANEAMTSYYGRVATVNRMFREGGAAEIPGWRTDRGRIYLKYGPPSAVLNRPRPPSANPYEVWRYEKGRLLKFEAVPTQYEETPALEKEPDWSALFAEAELDMARFTNAAPVWTPEVYCDRRVAWAGTHPWQTNWTMRVEAGSFAGKPVHFAVSADWQKPEPAQPVRAFESLYDADREARAVAAELVTIDRSRA